MKITALLCIAGFSALFAQSGSAQNHVLRLHPTLSGSKASMDVQDMDNSLAPVDARTIELWFYAESDPGSSGYLIQKRNAFTGSYLISMHDELGCDTWINGAAHTSTTCSAAYDRWNHLALVADGINGTVKWYVNGVLQGCAWEGEGTPFQNDQTGDPFQLGRFDPYGVQFFGNLDNVRIWSSARTEAEIQEFMYMDITPEEIALNPSLYPTLEAAWNFESGTDDSTGVHPGTLEGEAVIVVDTAWDCQPNGIPDPDDIANGTSQDCNANYMPDECEISNGSSGDCNNNTIPDECDIASGVEIDCNIDGIPDSCQILENPLLDLDGNGVIDTCECLVITYCSTSPNTVGPGARIGMGGSPFISSNNLVLIADDVPTNQFGIFYYGPLQNEVPFGSGYRCVGGSTRRLPVVNSGSLGVAVYYLDLLNQPAHPHQITPGDTWNFQYWYRDPSDGNAGFNLSDGLSITFCD